MKRKLYKIARNQNQSYRSVIKTHTEGANVWSVKACAPRWTLSFISANWSTWPWA